MFRSKLALFIDSFIISNLITFAIYIWFRNKIKNANLLHFFLILIDLLLFIGILLFLMKRNNKKIFRSNNEKYLNNCINYLIQCNFDFYSEFICKLLSCEKITTYFYKLNKNFLYINIKTPLSSKDYFDAQELFFKNKNGGDEKLIFIHNKKDASFEEIEKISKLNFSTQSQNVLTNLMQQKNCYPMNKDDITKPPFKQRIKSAFKTKTSAVTKSHFKEIFFTSISLLFLSLIVPFSNYYLVVGTTLLIISIISLFKKDLPQDNQDIDIYK